MKSTLVPLKIWSKTESNDLLVKNMPNLNIYYFQKLTLLSEGNSTDRKLRKGALVLHLLALTRSAHHSSRKVIAFPDKSLLFCFGNFSLFFSVFFQCCNKTNWKIKWPINWSIILYNNYGKTVWLFVSLM